jgi:trigger factor
MFIAEANRRVQLGLLVGEVIRQEKIELDQSLVDAAIEEMAVAYEQPEQVREYYRQNRQARTGIENMVLEDQVVNHILDKAKVTEKKASFEDLMNGNI